MKDIYGRIKCGDKEYRIVFNYNVIDEIQQEYGTLEKWTALSDGSAMGESSAKAIKFGIREMINEGIDIANDENGTNIPHVTLKQVGRIITEIGYEQTVTTMQDVVIESTKSDEKNA